MYHSGVKKNDSIRIGRSGDCGIRLEHDSVSRWHATAKVTDEGYIAVHDEGSSNGSFLHRNGRWVRIRRAILGAQDRIRFGEKEVPLDELVRQFGSHGAVRLREGYSARGRPLVFDNWPGDMPKPRTVYENPRRNPLTGDIEEYRKD